jgi:hypothetical protein
VAVTVAVGLAVGACVLVLVGVADTSGVFVGVRVDVAVVCVRSIVAVGGSVAVAVRVGVPVAARVAVAAAVVETKLNTWEVPAPLFAITRQ